MSMRHATVVASRGEVKIAQFGKYRGYPSGDGAVVLRFCAEYLASAWGRAAFAARVDGLRFATAADEGTVNAADEWRQDFWWLAAREGAHVLWDVAQYDWILMVQDARGHLHSSWLDWLWLINLDDNTLSACSTGEEHERHMVFPSCLRDDMEFKPLVLSARWSLDDLPSEAEFLAQLGEDEGA